MAEYDYIICGGGTSGCVVAGRLAEDPDVRILVIEAGAHNRDLENVHMVGGWSKNFDGPNDWNLVSEPLEHAGGRQVKLSRGRFLGGSSGCNGTLCVRGSKQDFDDWELPGWSGEEVFAAMRKAETFHAKSWFRADAEHGADGPLHIEPHDLAPISKLLLESFEDQGFPLDVDMFSHGERSHGCGHALRTHYRGVRTTGADFVTNERHRPNVDVLVNTVVEKINFLQTTDGLQASTVDVVGPDATRQTIKARREIIVSGGAYCTPAILMRSGIGPRAEVEKHGIVSLVDSPGVGQNLLDHLIVTVFYEVNQKGLTNDAKAHHGDGLAKSYEQWKQNRTGFMSSFPFGAFAYARLDERLNDDPLWQKAQKTAASGRDPMGLTQNQPNVEFFSTECYGGAKHYTDFPVNGNHVFSLLTELFSPRSKGSVALKSNSPHDNPIIDCNFLADPLDLLVLTEGVRLGNDIVMQGKGTKDIVKGSWPAHLSHHKFSTREEWLPYVKNDATTCYHAAGTAKIGHADDKFAVLDEKLRVRGVQGLRVADCSIMPTLHGGHTQMVAYAIGERCADFVKGDWGAGRERKTKMD
ncbi:hypothetical protein AC578_6529 [Pseudocercospora eumusae]|uniref:Glucose-methanol-choline oxidoreductase N-terminal domain-containing protein n=1 Tax=Pseudocercospora eumusae TaxID=321146 RepID=A0A139HHW2_9PEZI|nr:hypothetical protein AC578_6529 [Pseudocercospora eumusae]